ncbi:MAG: hypothetical protein ACYDH0_08625 [Candidatus Aminicenantales bacterium]
MDGRCPFCWDRNVRRVLTQTASRGGGRLRQLMECADCEKWYWADTGEEVPRLFEICSTSIVQPGRCCEEIREVLGSGGVGPPRRRLAEFNWLCGECPHGRFVAGKSAQHPVWIRASHC